MRIPFVFACLLAATSVQAATTVSCDGKEFSLSIEEFLTPQVYGGHMGGVRLWKESGNIGNVCTLGEIVTKVTGMSSMTDELLKHVLAYHHERGWERVTPNARAQEYRRLWVPHFTRPPTTQEI